MCSKLDGKPKIQNPSQSPRTIQTQRATSLNTTTPYYKHLPIYMPNSLHPIVKIVKHLLHLFMETQTYTNFGLILKSLETRPATLKYYKAGPAGPFAETDLCRSSPDQAEKHLCLFFIILLMCLNSKYVTF